MNILVLVKNYPQEANPALMAYVHTRNVVYQAQGHHVVVVNFSTNFEYQYEGISVMPAESVDINQFDIILSHAPNLINHLPFLNRCNNKIIVFFFHGHEVLKNYGEYPKPYFWRRKSLLVNIINSLYGHIKLRLLRNWFIAKSQNNRLGFVFVSNWMKDRFVSNVKLIPESVGKVEIINNSINNAFLDCSYEKSEELYADFVTIRPFDESKYAIDLVCGLAQNNPNYTFHIYGRGNYFKYNTQPSNIKVINIFFKQSEIPELLNHYRCALMPTRFDAQGVMACEIASYGMPLITTNIDICTEMLGSFSNVMFLDYKSFGKKIISLPKANSGNKLLFSNELINHEINFFEMMMQNK